MQMPDCGYFGHDEVESWVSQTPHEAAEGPLFFMVALPNGDAVRVPVCQEHAAKLRKLSEED